MCKMKFQRNSERVRYNKIQLQTKEEEEFIKTNSILNNKYFLKVMIIIYCYVDGKVYKKRIYTHFNVFIFPPRTRCFLQVSKSKRKKLSL